MRRRPESLLRAGGDTATVAVPPREKGALRGLLCYGFRDHYTFKSWKDEKQFLNKYRQSFFFYMRKLRRM